MGVGRRGGRAAGQAEQWGEWTCKDSHAVDGPPNISSPILSHGSRSTTYSPLRPRDTGSSNALSRIAPPCTNPRTTAPSRPRGALVAEPVRNEHGPDAHVRHFTPLGRTRQVRSSFSHLSQRTPDTGLASGWAAYHQYSTNDSPNNYSQGSRRGLEPSSAHLSA